MPDCEECYNYDTTDETLCKDCIKNNYLWFRPKDEI